MTKEKNYPTTGTYNVDQAVQDYPCVRDWMPVVTVAIGARPVSFTINESMDWITFEIESGKRIDTLYIDNTPNFQMILSSKHRQ